MISIITAKVKNGGEMWRMAEAITKKLDELCSSQKNGTVAGLVFLGMVHTYYLVHNRISVLLLRDSERLLVQEKNALLG